jgi:hypothetical protein
MLTNSQITLWENRSGDDAYGQPVLAAQPGGPWPVYTQEHIKTLHLGVRTVKTSAKVIGQRLPAVVEGDWLTIDVAGSSDRYQVITVDTTPGTTLGHTTLVLS